MEMFTDSHEEEEEEEEESKEEDFSQNTHASLRHKNPNFSYCASVIV